MQWANCSRKARRFGGLLWRIEGSAHGIDHHAELRALLGNERAQRRLRRVPEAAVGLPEGQQACQRRVRLSVVLLQEEAGRDLRVYVLHGRILAGVMRTAQSGVVSNFKKGGQVALHALTQEERELAEAVIRRFEQAGAPLHMAGIDLLYDHGHPVIGEVEDVVGSRMLYQTSEIDIVDQYLKGIAALVANES